MSELAFTLEFGLYGANYKPLIGARWRASFYDADRGQFYAGSSDCPWEAVGWALLEREQRVANQEHPTITKSEKDTPVQALARLRTATVTRIHFAGATKRPAEPATVPARAKRKARR